MKFKRWIVLGVAAATLSLAACSSGSSGSSGSDTGAGGSDAADTSAAEAFLKPYADPVTAIGPTVPLDGTPAPGKNVYWLQGNIASTQIMTPGMESAAKALGWSMTTIVFDPANPSAANGAVEQALSRGADYIAISGVTTDSFRSGLAEAKAKDVPIFNAYTTEAPKGEANGIYSNTGGLPQWELFGKILANYMIADSKGTADALFVSISAYDVLAAQGPVVKAEFEKNCSGCKYSEVDTTIDDLSGGAIPGIVTNYLRSHPDIDYVQLASGFMSANLESALKSAGLKDIKVISTNPGLADLKDISTGFQQASVGLPTAMSSWYIVDAMARQSLGMDLTANWDSPLPAQLITKATLPDPLALYDGPADYQDQFKKLWNVS